MPTAYDIRVRDASLNLVGEVTDYSKATIIKRFNNVGQCTLILNADDPMAPYLATPGYGLVISRTITNDAGVVTSQDGSFFTGDVWEFKRENRGGQKTLQVVAYDDLRRVACRDAWPVVIYPYTTLILSETGLQRFYELQETSGTTATDAANARNATYTNGPTLNQAVGAGVVDDPAVCVAFASASTQYAVTSDITGMPTGNNPFSIEGWFNATSFPASINEGAAFGKNATNSTANLFVDNTGVWKAGWNGGNAPAGSAVSAGTWHHVVQTYDGTTMRIYLDGALSGSANPGVALTLPSSAAEVIIGAFPITHGSPFNGKAFYVAFYSVALSATQIANHYNVGKNRFAYQASDVPATTNAETVIRHFVIRNCISGSVIADPNGNSRAVPNLAIAANGNRGSTITGVGTWDRLISKDGTGLLQRLALASSPALGFKVTQSGTTLTFSFYTPADKTSNAIFSDDLGNLGDFSYEVKGPDWEQGGNALVLGGSGTGTGRTYYLTTDAGSISAWGRVEQFLDQSNTSDAATLANAAAAAIVALKNSSSMSLQLVPNAALTYGIDFDLGDTVTYVIDGASLQDIVREVQIDLDPSSGEVVTPAVGTPGTAALMGALARYIADTQRDLAALRNRIANTERRQ